MQQEATLMKEEAARRLATLRRYCDSGTLKAEIASSLALEAAASFLSYYLKTGSYLRDDITLLCELTSLKEQELASAGLEALFPSLVERLNDSFEPDYCALYDSLFAQIIDFYRRLPEAGDLDAELHYFGLSSEQDLLARKARLRPPRGVLGAELEKIKKVLLLSRITLGADVAVTSVILKRFQEVLPEAEFVFIGSRKLIQLFGGDPRVRFREVSYERSGGVLARLKSWLEVVRIVQSELQPLQPDEVLIIDPDSRLTQLGLLPLVKNDTGYLFFESRSYRHPEASCLAQLTAHWVNELLGTASIVHPYLALTSEQRELGQGICQRLRAGGASALVSVSLGVGGNLRKRLPDPFEERLLRDVLAKATVILDKGDTQAERDQVNRIIELLRQQGQTVIEIDEPGAARVLEAEAIQAELLTWEGGIGGFAALIAGSDQYLGYDSAGQHLAAALGVPTLTIFVSSGSELFAERWHPYGPGVMEVLKIEAAELACVSLDEILARTLRAHHRLLTAHRKSS